MGSISKTFPAMPSRTPTSSELRAAVTAMLAAGYSLADHYREPLMWQISVHLRDATGNVASQLTVEAHLPSAGAEDVERYDSYGTSDAQRLLAFELARLAVPQAVFETVSDRVSSQGAFQ